MSRPDQSITFLRSFGFSVFRFPRASAQPLELMHRDGKDLTRLGMVPDLVDAGEIAAPDVRRDGNPGIDIEGKETSKVNVAIGLSILGGFISALGGGKLGLDVAFNKARTVTFQYTAVIEDVVDVLAVEKFVKAGRISPHIPSGTLEKLLDGEVYVVTSVLKTKKIVVAAQGENGADGQGRRAGHSASRWRQRQRRHGQRNGIESRLRGRRTGGVRVSGRATHVRRIRSVPDDAATGRRRSGGAGAFLRLAGPPAARSFLKLVAPSCAWRSKETR